MYVASLFLTQDFPSDYEKKESYVPFFHAKFTLKDNQMINNHVFIMLSLLPLSSIQIFIQSIVLCILHSSDDNNNLQIGGKF